MWDKLLTKEIISPIFIVIIAVLAYLLIKQIIIKMFKASSKFGVHKKSITIMNLIINIIKYVVMIVAILAILSNFGVDTNALLASLGVAGVIAGLALQDTLKDFLAGFSIIVDNEFDVGDNVKIGDFRGDVIELGMRNTKVRAYSGEVKSISNGNITEVINYSTQTSRCIVDLSVGYEASVEEAEEVLRKVCEDLSKRVTYLTSDVQLLGIEELGDSAVIYRVIADCEPVMDIGFKREVNRAVKKAFDESGLEIPYPQVEVHHD